MIRWRWWAREGGFGPEFAFDQAGEAIPIHYHDPGFSHSVRCLSGRVRLYSDVPGWGCEVAPGEEVAIQPGQLHAIEALEPGTTIFNRWEMLPDDLSARLAGTSWQPFEVPK
jgi:hypothetical protein